MGIRRSNSKERILCQVNSKLLLEVANQLFWTTWQLNWEQRKRHVNSWNYVITWMETSAETILTFFGIFGTLVIVQ